MYNRRKEILKEIELLSIATTVATAIVPSLIFSYMLFKKSKVDKELTKKLRELLKESKIKWEIRILPTKLPNAFSTGDIRVYLTQGTLDLMTQDEALAVVLHEIAHSRYLHIPASILQIFGLKAFSTWLEAKIQGKIIEKLVKIGSAKLYVRLVGKMWWWLPLLMLLLNFALLITTSRWFSYRKEKQADMFAIKLGYGKHLASALVKLHKKIQTYTPPIYLKPIIFVMKLMNNHPELQERLQYCLEDKEVEKHIKSGNKDGAIKIFINKLRGK